MVQTKVLNSQNFGQFADDCSTGIFVENISLSNFRNYDDLRLKVATGTPEPVVLFGQNGSGKTNLLEAISYLTAGRGLRGAKLSEVGKVEGGSGLSWAVSAEVSGHAGQTKIGTGLAPNPKQVVANQAKQMDRRLVRVDGTAASGPAALAEVLSMVWLTPKMDRLFLEGSSSRRKFFDRFVQGLHPSHSRHLGAYERTMRERISILADQSRAPDPSWLAALEKRMAEHGVALAAARNETLAHLTTQINEQGEGAFPSSALSLDGWIESQLHERSALEVEDNFIKALENSRPQDKVFGRTSIGPHKTDLLVHHIKKDMPARLCSTGEQKALLIGIVLADVRLQKALCGHAPILLLDEISAHLDEHRRAGLFDELINLNCQAWLTGTDKNLFGGLENRAKFLSVTNGRIEE